MRNLLLFIVLCLFSCENKSNSGSENKMIADSVAFYIQKSKKENSALLLQKAREFNYSLKDSTKNQNLLKIAFEASKKKDSSLFRATNNEAFSLSIKLKDTLGLADYHWNFGAFYGANEQLDSSYYHYYKANKLYNLIGHKNYSAKMLYNMAFLQSRAKDYTSSETKLFRAISIYKSLNKNLSLYKCYSLLATIYGELEDYDKAILYHNNALSNLKLVNNIKTYKERSLNDIGLIYFQQSNLDESIKNYSEALKSNNLFYNDIKLYAKLKDNLGYSKLKKGDTINVMNYFSQSLKIRDSINDLSGLAIGKLHLAEYYAIKTDTIKATTVAKEVNTLAVKINNNRDVLASLLLLSKLDKENSSTYFNKHVALTKKLDKQERLLRNKFARISFETDEYIEKTERLTLQNYIVLISSISVFMILSLLYYIRIQEAKNKELRLEKEQQKANEDIYRLLLKQQSKLEEGRLKERHRISEELHDGILGKIFGARMGLGFLDLKGETEELKKYERYTNDLQKIEEDIRNVSHELKNETLLFKADYISLIDAYVKSQSKVGAYYYTINSKESAYWNDSNGTIKINCYRIVQEAIQNIIKHSKANNVILDFDFKYGNLIFNICDDGVGFQNKDKVEGIGLINIRSRVEVMKGKIKIETSPNNGTKIELKIPNIS